MIALDLERTFAVKAKEKEAERKSTFPILGKSEHVYAAEQAAKLAGTNHQYVVDAKTIQAKAENIHFC